jgi:hypothetical protein
MNEVSLLSSPAGMCSGGRRQRRQRLPARWPLRKSETPHRWPGSSLRGVGSLETLRKSNIPHSYEADQVDRPESYGEELERPAGLRQRATTNLRAFEVALSVSPSGSCRRSAPTTGERRHDGHVARLSCPPSRLEPLDHSETHAACGC